VPAPIAIAVDAMGGDRAPEVVVQGALEALEAYEDVEVRLVGRPEAIEPLVGGERVRLTIVPAPEVIGMEESPGRALRNKPNSSIAVCAGLLQRREVQAIVSAGNTGAVAAAAVLSVRLLPGVHRPGIAATFPNARGHTTLCDVGANIHTRPTHFVQYGVMAAAFNELVLGVERPRVAVLSIGQEESKGGAAVDAARKAMDEAAAAAAFHFVGAVEGNHIFEGAADVVVCDGFVGNVILKAAEGVGRTLIEQFVQACRGAGDAAPGEAEWLQRGLERLEAITDYSEYGGAPLLGIDGCAIIAHGRSDARAVLNALRVAREYSRVEVNRHITERLAALGQGVA